MRSRSDSRDDEVLAVLRDNDWRRVLMTPSELCRALNWIRPRDWCPVGPPAAGQQCAAVPEPSRRAVDAVLKRLFNHGLVAVCLSRRAGKAVKTYLDPFVTQTTRGK